MPVYSKIQQIRDTKRRERQQKWKLCLEESRIKNQENCHSLSPRFGRESRGKIQQNL